MTTETCAFCTIFAIGSCGGCGRKVCGYHHGFHANAVECSGCRADRLAREAEAEEASRRDAAEAQQAAYDALPLHDYLLHVARGAIPESQRQASGLELAQVLSLVCDPPYAPSGWYFVGDIADADKATTPGYLGIWLTPAGEVVEKLKPRLLSANRRLMFPPERIYDAPAVTAMLRSATALHRSLSYQPP